MGLGVPENRQKVFALFASTDYEDDAYQKLLSYNPLPKSPEGVTQSYFVQSRAANSRELITLIDHGLLPKRPEDLTPSYLQTANAKIEAQEAKRHAEENAQEQWWLARPDFK